MAQRLVEPNGTKLTGAVILKRETNRKQVEPCETPTQPSTARAQGPENIFKHAPRAHRSLLAVNDTATKKKTERARPPFYSFISILL